MPEDIKYIVNQSQLTAIGTAIRGKLNEQTTYTVDEMPEKIGDISAGGGGGGSSIPMMTLTVIAPAGTTEEETYSWVCFDNNNMLQAPILTEGENIIKMLYMQMGDEVFPATYRNIGTHTFSNLINCILDEDALLITDPTIDSSATLTITSWEDIG